MVWRLAERSLRVRERYGRRRHWLRRQRQAGAGSGRVGAAVAAMAGRLVKTFNLPAQTASLAPGQDISYAFEI